VLLSSSDPGRVCHRREKRAEDAEACDSLPMHAPVVEHGVTMRYTVAKAGGAP